MKIINWFNNLNLPNKLTIIRIIAIPVFLFFLYFTDGIFRFLPLIIFIAAALTDAIDGYIARRDNLVSSFGKFMDPLADKLLTCSAFIAFVDINYLSSLVVVIIISREFLVSGFRTLAASNGITIAANSWGKFKTIFQMVLIIFILLDYTGYIGFAYIWIGPLTFIAVILTIVSGATYIIDNIEVLK